MKIICPCICYGSFILLLLLLLRSNICSSDFSTKSWNRAILPFQHFKEYCTYLQLYSPNKKHAASKNLPLEKFYVFWLVVYCRSFVINYSHLQPDLCNFHNTTKKKVYSFCRCIFTICSSFLSSVFCMSVRTAAVQAPQYTDLASLMMTPEPQIPGKSFILL